MSRRFALAAGIAAALAAPGAAGAATLTVSGGAATLTGDAKANTLVAVDVQGLGTFFGDQNAPTNNPGLLSGCTSLGPPVAPFAGVACLGITSVTINGGAGADQLVANTPHSPSLNGEAGDDTLIGGRENDVFRGGYGTDRVAYVAPTGAGIDRSVGVKATLPPTGGAPTTGNGQTGESDTIASDIEGLVGGQGDDVLTGNSGPNTIAGAAPPGTASVATSPAGRDTVTGGGGDDTLLGGDSGVVDGGVGDDQVVGGRSRSAATVVRGGDGDDTLVSNVGKDELIGGPGNNTLAYASVSLAGISRKQGITLRLPDAGSVSTGNGAPGEGDIVHSDFTTLAGGNGSDRITGNSRANRIAGVAPDGTPGVTPGPPGNDTLEGGKGNDSMLGSSGNDTLLARDGEIDTVLFCGTGVDRVVADAKIDLAGANCEDIERSGAKGKDKTAPRLSAFPRKLKLRKGRRVRLSVRCRNEKKGCRGRVQLRLGKRTLARKGFSAKGRARKRVTLRLSRKAVRRLKAKGRTKVGIRVTAHDRAGNERTRTFKGSVRR